jgi:hypothetical protein
MISFNFKYYFLISLNMKVIINSVADIRKGPKFESERISQLVYGEKVDILKKLGEYILIKSEDGVEGYVKSANINDGDERFYKLNDRYRNKFGVFSFGSYFSEEDVKDFKIPKKFLSILDKKFDYVKLSKKFIGTPYLWGGTSDFGFDCSGFVQRLFKFSNNMIIPRNSVEQMNFTKNVNGFSNAKKGDLVFFKGHVAIYLGNFKIIHANGHYSSVRITDLSDGSDYSKYLLSIMLKIGRVE